MMLSTITNSTEEISNLYELSSRIEWIEQVNITRKVGNCLYNHLNIPSHCNCFLVTAKKNILSRFDP